MMDWDKLRIFHAVADKGSLTHAGEVLHLSQSAVSRQIRALEESLSVTLFHRHARGLILTEQGELLFDATSQMVRRLDAAAARIRDSEDEVFGELRVTTTTGFGTLWLAPRLAALYSKYPALKIDLMLEERVLDLPMREADVAIRMKEPQQADLIRKRFPKIEPIVVLLKFDESPWNTLILKPPSARWTNNWSAHAPWPKSPTWTSVRPSQLWNNRARTC